MVAQRRRRSRRKRLLVGGAFGALLTASLLWLNRPGGPLRLDPLLPSRHSLVVDERLELARRYAPFLYVEFHPTKGRQDIPAPVDFDGDLRGDNNWDRLPSFELLPTLYYAVLETETHLFLTYHVFHPRDWTLIDVGLHLTHENDGENLQVVVDKATEEVVLLLTQAHYRGTAYANGDAGFADGAQSLRGGFQLVDDAGFPSRAGRHACVFIESGGHGLCGATDRRSRVVLREDGSALFAGSGWILHPNFDDDPVYEPPLETGARVPYQLESTTAKLWPPLVRGELTGEGGLLDRALRYSGEHGTVEVPRYYEADRFSGPFGPDRGISPFAVDFEFGAGEVGALFFDPARRYMEQLTVPQPWSLEYTRYPYEFR